MMCECVMVTSWDVPGTAEEASDNCGKLARSLTMLMISGYIQEHEVDALRHFHFVIGQCKQPQAAG